MKNTLSQESSEAGTDQLLSLAENMQRKLAEHNVQAVLFGGLATNLQARKRELNPQTVHKDIDLLIPLRHGHPLDIEKQLDDVQAELGLELLDLPATWDHSMFRNVCCRTALTADGTRVDLLGCFENPNGSMNIRYMPYEDQVAPLSLEQPEKIDSLTVLSVESLLRMKGKQLGLKSDYLQRYPDHKELRDRIGGIRQSVHFLSQLKYLY